MNVVPESELTELLRCINETRWPERETVADQSQSVQLATIQKFARYRASGCDWRKCEAPLNALSQFTTEIDGLDIHFIHVRSKHERALPRIVSRMIITVAPALDAFREAYKVFPIVDALGGVSAKAPSYPFF